GHAVSIIGYNDADKAWIAKNSWGEEFGEKGYFRIAYDDASNLGSQSFLLEVPASNQYVAIGNLRDDEVLSGTVNIDVTSTFSNTQSVEYTLNRNGAPVWWGKSNRIRGLSVDTTKVSDGIYTLVVTAHHAGGIAS